MSNEHTEEELKIVKEQDRVATLRGDVFKLPISELPTPPAAALDVGATIGDAIGVMQEGHFGSVLITRNGKLAGIITERDILNKVIGKMDDFRTRPVTDAMTPDPLRLLPGDMIAHVMNSMHVGGYRHVPIVDENDAPVSIISIKDVMTFILDHFPAEIANTVSEPYRGPAEREGA